MTLSLHSEAREELLAAHLRHRTISETLGKAFLEDFERTLALLRERPHAWHPLRPARLGLRRLRFSRFPYGLVYRVQDDAIVIFAVMHLKRQPGYWRSRID